MNESHKWSSSRSIGKVYFDENGKSYPVINPDNYIVGELRKFKIKERYSDNQKAILIAKTKNMQTDKTTLLRELMNAAPEHGGMFYFEWNDKTYCIYNVSHEAERQNEQIKGNQVKEFKQKARFEALEKAASVINQQHRLDRTNVSGKKPTNDIVAESEKIYQWLIKDL